YINELIEYIFLSNKHNNGGLGDSDRSSHATASVSHDHPVSKGDVRGSQPESKHTSSIQSSDLTLVKSSGESKLTSSEHGNPKSNDASESHIQQRPADWAMVLEAATKRRSQVLAPENLDNMWTKGRNYQKKTVNLLKAEKSSGLVRSPGVGTITHTGTTEKDSLTNLNERITYIDDKYMVNLMYGSNPNTRSNAAVDSRPHASQDLAAGKSNEEVYFGSDSLESASKVTKRSRSQMKRSSSTPDIGIAFMGKSGETIASHESPNSGKEKEVHSAAIVLHSEGSLSVPKLRCRVVGAYFEKTGSKSFAVYSIAVTDTDNKTWFVKRRHAFTMHLLYRNFERLHRYLKEIPNYSLQLPPKRFLSSSIDDYLVHQRCILLDKYLQELLSIANIAEQHEVWDFLCASSKNYSFGKSTSVMKTLAVNVDDAMDDIVRQFKGVSDGLKRKVVNSSPSYYVASSPLGEKSMALSWNGEDTNKHNRVFSNVKTSHSLSDDESHYEGKPLAVNDGWHSDNELNSKEFPPRVVKRIEETCLESQRNQQLDKLDRISFDGPSALLSPDLFQDPVGMPPEWTPPNVSVPLLNLVDKIFQLKQRGWLRRQVYWISKQILQLMMEDAIDDWILRQIHLLRRDDVIAQGIRWVHDVLWPNGTFFTRLEGFQSRTEENQPNSGPVQSTNRMYGDKASRPSSFEQQLEASRRASDVKNLLLSGAPTALVSLIGHKQYRRCARDIYYFLQSTVCVKQLAYTMLELVLLTVFPELRELVADIHENARNQRTSENRQS
ncbi:hypothetical protein ACMD2_23123, partial [Ananas comosus]